MQPNSISLLYCLLVVYVKHLLFGKRKSLGGFHDRKQFSSTGTVIIIYVCCSPIDYNSNKVSVTREDTENKHLTAFVL